MDIASKRSTCPSRFRLLSRFCSAVGVTPKRDAIRPGCERIRLWKRLPICRTNNCGRLFDRTRKLFYERDVSFVLELEVSVHPSSTIDVYGLSGDVVGVVRGEERRHLADVFRSLFLLHWDSLFDDFLKQLSACQFLRIEAR